MRVTPLTLVVKPPLDFTLDPVALLSDAARACEPSIAILLTVDPGAFIFAIIRPSERTLALFAIVDKLTFVHSPVNPPEDSLSMHFIRLPFSFKVTAIAPFVFAEATDIVLLELSNVARSVLPAK